MEINETEPLGVADLPDRFIDNYGRVKFALETLPEDGETVFEKITDLNLTHVRHNKIIEHAIRGLDKRTIANHLRCSVTTVEQNIYSERGQIRIIAALEESNKSIMSTLPTLMNEALLVLEDVLTKNGDPKRLAAVDRVLALHARVEKMAHLNAVKTTKNLNANV
jgi:hypothetical protein